MNSSTELDYFALNAMLNLPDAEGNIDFESDKKAVKKFFLEHVNKKTMFFHDLEEKIDYLIKNDYYEKSVFDNYSWNFVKSLFKKAYSYKFRFETYLGALKFYTGYALKSNDGECYIERYEDRVAMNALYLANGKKAEAEAIVDELMTGRFQPATPTFLNAGRKNRGELVSCYLVRTEDNMESIARTITSSLQLSKRGGGVAINLTNVREFEAPIKNIDKASSGVVPIMKILEDSFSYANQLGQRQGAGAVYIHAHHPDVMRVLDTKRENADEKIRIKTLSVGIVVPDITFDLARKNEDMYLFSPYDVEKEYGKPFSDISVTEEYHNLVDNPKIRKSKINARDFFKTVAELNFESGYPYLMFEDTVNRENPIHGKITMSNLCSEILQVSEPSLFNEDGTYSEVGKDISCNLGSLNVAKTMDGGNIEKTVETAVRSLSAVSRMSNISSVPSIQRGNNESHAIGLGQMNLHGFLMREGIEYGSELALDFVNVYFYTVLFYALKASNKLAQETKSVFKGFEKSKYADGSFFDKYLETDILDIKFEETKNLFDKFGITIPNKSNFYTLRDHVKRHGLYNQNLQAIPPTGSISYINNSTSSIHPVASKVEVRKEGKIGRVYYPSPFLTNENKDDYKDAYEIGYEKIIDTYAVATHHVDQGLSLTLFFKDTHTTRDINKAQMYAWKKGIKTIYYIRIRQDALEGTKHKITVEDTCTSCTL